VPELTPDVIRRRVLVDGRVQGVFFRQSCRREAELRGVTGWVRNRSDGRVEAVFEGSPDAVEAMVAWCRGGPPGARVDEVEVADEAAEGPSAFRIVPST
jgi:acylphosphatase